MDTYYGNATTVTSLKDGQIDIAGGYFNDMDEGGFLVMTLSPDGLPMHVTEYPRPLTPLGSAILSPIGMGVLDNGQTVIAGAYKLKDKPESAYVLWFDQKGMFKNGHIYSLRNAVDTPVTVGSFTIRREVGATNRIALVGNSGAVGVVRAMNEPGDQAIALLIDEQGNVSSEVSVRASGTQSTNHSNSEYDDIAPLQDGSFALLGTTDGFGAPIVNFIFSVWTPHDNTSALFNVFSIDVQAAPVPVPAVSGDTDRIENVPASKIDVTELKVSNLEHP